MNLPFAFKVSELPNAVRKSWVWMAINVIVFIAYLFFSLWCWPGYENGKFYDDTNSAIGFGLTCLPILILMFLVNGVWFVVSFLKGNRPAIFIWLLVVLVWITWVSFQFYVSYHAIPF
jgi:hypothetical protein